MIPDYDIITGFINLFTDRRNHLFHLSLMDLLFIFHHTNFWDEIVSCAICSPHVLVDLLTINRFMILGLEI